MKVAMSPAGEARREARALHHARRPAMWQEAKARRAEGNVERAEEAAEATEVLT